jgi:hypothetical protein
MATNNIIGEEFADYVQKQITVRQKIHGSGTSNNPRPIEYLNYLNSKTAWVKLASGVSISKERLEREGMDSITSGMDLAKKRVLFGGVASLEGKKLTQRGTNSDRNLNITDPDSGTYNVNQKNKIDDLEFGLVPMPGITSVDIKNKNRGSIKEATIKITAYTREQFDFIDLLYMRLGYTVFLEWGWSIYFDNNEDNMTINYSLIEAPDGFFDERWGTGNNTFSGFLNKITAYRRAFNGNYDGLLAKVRNFDWTISENGTYDITLSLISVGDVIESLKMNIPPTKETLNFLTKRASKSNLSGINIPTDNALLAHLYSYGLSDYLSENRPIDQLQFKIKESGNNKSANIGRFVNLKGLFKININKTYDFEEDAVKQEFKSAQEKYIEIKQQYKKEIDNGSIIFEALIGKLNIKDRTPYDTSNPTLPPRGENDGSGSPNNVRLSIKGTIYLSPDPELETTEATLPANNHDVFALNILDEEGEFDYFHSYYMRLGYLLQYIDSTLIPIEKNTGEKIINIFTFQGVSQRMYYFPYQQSYDPRVCLVNSSIPTGLNRFLEILPQLPQWFEEGGGYAYPMNIYVNFSQIVSSVNDNLDEEGNLSLFDFLSSLCISINKALGGVNNLEPVIEEETNTIKIIDGSYTTNKKPATDYALELYGYNPSNTSSNFVRNFSVKSTVSKEYASMISIGATAAGYTKGMEATMFSKWNDGIIDRFKEEYVPQDPSTNPTGSQNEAVINYIENVLFKNPLEQLASKSNRNYWNLDTDLINSQINFADDFHKYCQYQLRLKYPKYGSPIIGFVPVSLNLSLDGISGMKIYNVVRTSTRFLPKNYTDSLRFITTSVNHKLNNNDWETTIDTISIPQNYDEEGNEILPYNDLFEEVNRILIESATLKYGPQPPTTVLVKGVTRGGGGSVTARANSAGIDQLNSDPSISNTPLLKKAVSDQSIYMFTKVGYNGGAPGERTGVCAGYTFNIAQNLKEHIDKESSQSIPITYKSSGAANSNAHRSAIDNLGLYKRRYLGSFTAEQLRNSDSIINTTKWNYGDILNYYSPGNSGGTNMHSQIYTGDIWQKSVYVDQNDITQTRGNSGWTTSVATNYGGKFIYKGNKVFKVYAFKVKDEYLK